MKISKLFHWLYAILMFLPFVSVLSFTLYYAFNKNAEIPMVTENVSKEVDFNQLVRNGDFINLDNWSAVSNRGTLSVSNNVLDYTIVETSGANNNRVIQSNVNITLGNKYLIRFGYFTSDSDLTGCGFSFNGGGNSQYFGNVVSNVWFNVDFIFTAYNNYDTLWLFSSATDTLMNIGDVFSFRRVNIFNLTQMFGVGNEPSIQDFDSWFTDYYYDYTLSTHVVIDNYSTREVIDSPINHIWLPSFGGMGWMIKNVFTFLISTMFGISVTSGIGYTILYLITYWLCISLIWLIYDVIMYVPLMIHRWLDKGVIE